ncbi:MAG: hypothetical protein M1822_006276 [Bathelium mastoideum]|nr:MAG: hypothetical protein M1822_006276 [Bathelium mastoideum]
MDEPLRLSEGLPTIELPKVSLAKLLNDDELEAQTVFDICCRTGFFYLNLMDHAKGEQLWESACLARQIGQNVMSNLSTEEKNKFVKRSGTLDRGYASFTREENGQTSFYEAINIPQDELFAKQRTAWRLPVWLEQYESNFMTILREGNVVANIILGILEKQLQLGSGILTSSHRLADASHSFLRILRYPGLKDGQPPFTKPRVLPHRDSVSIAMLFTWVCGLQIPEEHPTMIAPDFEAEDSWRWVVPVYGHAIVNLGDAMPLLTNGKLASGKHRVVHATGEQAKLDKISVLVSARPADSTPMKALKSPIIPQTTPEQKDKKIESAKEWGDNLVNNFIKKMNFKET